MGRLKVLVKLLRRRTVRRAIFAALSIPWVRRVIFRQVKRRFKKR